MERFLMGRTKQEQIVGQWHYYTMLVMWLIFANLGLWAQMFPQHKFAMYLHFVSMMIVTVSTWMSGFLAFIYFGIDDHIGKLHIFLGIFILFVVLIQAIVGIVTWILQKSSKITPFYIHRIGTLHKVCGWLIFILVNAQILIATEKYYKKIFYTTLFTSLFSYLPYLILKARKKKIQPHNIEKKKNQVPPMLIQSSRDLNQFKQQYFIFQDKVYDLQKVITNHPGGYQIIKNIKTRQVDRYLYGSQPLGTDLKLQLHHHSIDSIKLARDPIAHIANTPLFLNLNQVNQVSVAKLSKPCRSSKLHSVYLQSKFRPFQYKGYENLSQFGKYYALTINNKITRLYTIVNFLNQQNIQFMSRVFSTSLQEKQFQTIQSTSIMQISQQSYIQKTEKNLSDAIPLLIKKYDNGKFTNKLFARNNKNSLVISRPYGRGLKLNQIKPGKLVLFSGGTGLHPFCDLIDIMYKEYLINTNNNQKQQILALNPLLSNDSLLKKFQFTFYISVHDLSQISQITKHQLSHLKKNQLAKVFIKVDENIQASQFQFEYVNTRFQKYLAEMIVELEQISQIYVCGPPLMNYKLQNCLIKLNVSKQKYTML